MMPRTILFLTLLLLLGAATGCTWFPRRTKAAAPPAAPPPSAPRQPVETHPLAPPPPVEAKPPLAPVEIPAPQEPAPAVKPENEPGAAPAVKPQSAGQQQPRRTARPAKKPQPAPVQEPAAPPAAAEAPPPQAPLPRLGEVLTSQQHAAYLVRLDQDTAEVRRLLGTLNSRTLSREQSQTLARVRSFIEQALALRDSDVSAAAKLARRALLLAQDVAASAK